MKQLFFLLLFISTLSFSQDFSVVDAKVKKYPKYRTPSDLAERIQKDFSSDMNKVRAAFIWLSNNIRYDLRQYRLGKKVIQYEFTTEQDRLQKVQQIRDDIVSKAFQKRSGVCEEYAQSLKKICDLLGIEAEVIKGNVRNSGSEIGRPKYDTNHAWNVVRIDNRWIIMDATWASGFVMNNKWNKQFSEYYFDIPTTLIGKTHFPDTKKWQILWEVRSKEIFYNQPLYYDYFLKRRLSYPSKTKGTLLVKRGNPVEIDIKGLSLSDKMYIGYSNDQYSKRPKILKSNFGQTLIVAPPVSNTEMFLFINGKLSTIFKVILK